MRDFTLNTYRLLISELQSSGFGFYTLSYVCKSKPKGPFVVLRHDVDRKPGNSLRMAQLEYEAGIVSTYYFRMTDKVFDPACIKEISEMGHEVGYHFEDLSYSHGNIDEAVRSFRNNVEKFRKIVPLHTVSMHGSPLSRFDNKELIKRIDLEELGIVCEPYSVIDDLDLIYLTDVGRKWNNSSVNLRDKVDRRYVANYKTTFDIIEALGKELKGKKLMLNIHPERWEDDLLPWMSNAAWQKMKNGVKFVLIRMRHGS